jgi:hypothetical protein
MELGDEVVGLLEQNLQQEEHTAQMRAHKPALSIPCL